MLEDRIHSKQNDKNQKIFTYQDSREQDAEDNHDLGLSSLEVKTVDTFNERLEQLQRLFIREAKRSQRQLELSQTREEV